MNKRFQILLQYPGSLPKFMESTFRYEREAREILQRLRTVCQTITLCEFHKEQGEYVLKKTYEYEGFSLKKDGVLDSEGNFIRK